MRTGLRTRAKAGSRHREIIELRVRCLMAGLSHRIEGIVSKTESKNKIGVKFCYHQNGLSKSLIGVFRIVKIA